MPVAGMRERNGGVSLFPAERVSQARHVRSHPPPRGSPIYTDDFPSYTGPERLWYRHRRVNHSARQYVKGQVRTNSIESVWAILKRGFYGTYHHWSRKHCSRYLNEFAWRINQSVNTAEDWLGTVCRGAFGKRLTWAMLTK
ncbi:MAG: hypothetical protein M2R46_00440 [Verrucomicrobia subdivision 3 bacterium]|nr:hypothetical protein [Limisphaerales bacterium]